MYDVIQTGPSVLTADRITYDFRNGIIQFRKAGKFLSPLIGEALFAGDRYNVLDWEIEDDLNLASLWLTEPDLILTSADDVPLFEAAVNYFLAN